LVEFLHFDIQSTGQKSHCVNTELRPSQCYVLIRQSDSPCQRQFLVGSYVVSRSPHAPKSSSKQWSPTRDQAPAGRPRSAETPHSQSRPTRPRASYQPPETPYPKSQFLSRSFESILPTSLTYILPSTRGCSPWRPAAVMGTTGRENPPARNGRDTPLDFQGPSAALRTPQKRGALPAERPLLRLTRFRGPPLSQSCQGEERTPPGATAGVSRFV
jgi:hypothetical protein